MANETRWASISGRITHGTATPVLRASVIPTDKRAKEVFWASALVVRLPDLQPFNPSVESCLDDSHGNHDVIVKLDNGETIGIQVTELTYELQRARNAQNENFVSNVLACFEKRGLSTERRLLVSCFVPFIESGRYIVPKPEVLADATASFISSALENELIELDCMRVQFEWIDEGMIYVPSVAGIGIHCDLDALPRTVEMYRDAISSLSEKKADSNSPWLLIWSQSYNQDKHWLGKQTLHHMQNTFANSPFKKVYFLESMDGPGFETNLEVHSIKESNNRGHTAVFSSNWFTRLLRKLGIN